MTPTQLNTILEAAGAGLEKVERKRMPGGYALFVAGKIFANVTVDGRIGLKLSVPWCFEELASLSGADLWKLRDRVMDGWLLVPERFHGDQALLQKWIARAHGCAAGTIALQRTEFDFFEAETSPATARSEQISVFPREAASGTQLRGMHAIAPPAVPIEASQVSASVNAGALTVSSAPAVIIDDEDDAHSSSVAVIQRTRTPRSFTPPPSSRTPLDLSSYAPPPPSSVGIRVVPRDSKSPYEDTLIGVPAPSSSSELGEPRAATGE